MNAACPRCGKAVPVGYVRCPDRTCRAILGRTPSRTSSSPGGTVAKSTSPAPFVIIGLAVVVLGIAFWLLVRDTKKKPAAAADDGSGSQATGEQIGAPAVATGGTTRRVEVFDPNPTRPAAVPDPRVAANELQRQLQRQKLWSTVEVIGERADIRSNVCTDANLVATVNGATQGLRTAGLTRLRCLEQSGRVVFTRDL
jgi:hypothetical protein